MPGTDMIAPAYEVSSNKDVEDDSSNILTRKDRDADKSKKHEDDDASNIMTRKTHDAPQESNNAGVSAPLGIASEDGDASADSPATPRQDGHRAKRVRLNSDRDRADGVEAEEDEVGTLQSRNSLPLLSQHFNTIQERKSPIMMNLFKSQSSTDSSDSTHGNGSENKSNGSSNDYNNSDTRLDTHENTDSHSGGTDHGSGTSSGVGFGSKSRTPSDNLGEIKSTRFGTSELTAAYSGGNSYGSGTTGGAGSGNKTSTIGEGKSDSFSGTLMEKTGKILHQDKLAEKGREKREARGFGQEGVGSLEANA
ncbi:hypothetical protein EV356DRAFT_535165 [Viridothelium virens]|uniref:Uncharacterized protein n=1 Tax=Viridothelium virens TaxID=1048519 RepID=A0A6A6H293_VIRVR|nr:hypothetical protein EV356DRAFT_535165 [Viridothelium virens]